MQGFLLYKLIILQWLSKTRKGNMNEFEIEKITKYSATKTLRMTPYENIFGFNW